MLQPLGLVVYLVPLHTHDVDQKTLDQAMTPQHCLGDESALERSYLVAVASESSDLFVAARYYEGIRWRTVLRGFVPPPARLLDLGAGNGAIELAMSAGGYKAFSVEREWNDVARILRVRRVIADCGGSPV